MLERLRNLTDQLTGEATKAASGLTGVIGSQVGNLTDSASVAAVAASDHAIRMATNQMGNALRIAIDQLNQRPLPAPSVTLCASVGLGATMLQMQIVVTDSHLQRREGGSASSAAQERESVLTASPVPNQRCEAEGSIVPGEADSDSVRDSQRASSD
ncbi:MAG: hypothetical protein AB7I30_00475 [Isosphaeraceae bacterium]